VAANQKSLWRYTNLASAINILSRKEITLLPPNTWEDRNDAYFMETYKDRKKLKTLLAICLTSKLPRFHFWKVFAGGSDGICIEFNKDALREQIPSSSKTERFHYNFMEYKALKELASEAPQINSLPFLKRSQYQDEGEYRIIYENKTAILDSYPIQIPISCITKITLGPGLNAHLVAEVRKSLRSIPGCNAISIRQTTIQSNEKWRNFALKAHE